jgi:hypothetical protein
VQLDPEDLVELPVVDVVTKSDPAPLKVTEDFFKSPIQVYKEIELTHYTHPTPPHPHCG